MTRNPQAEALVAALLEGEDPKSFFKQHLLTRAAEAGYKKVAAFDLEDIGIDNHQYFTGRGTSYTDWDAVYVGVGDNPHESIDDALDQAAQDGWAVEPISTAEWPESPSVSEEYPDDEDCEMTYYTAVWLRAPGPGEAALYSSTQEAEDPKDFMLRMRKNPPKPPGWPQFDRWQTYQKTWNNGGHIQRRRAFIDVKRSKYNGRGPDGQPIYEPYSYRHGLRNTRFYRDKARREHWVEFHATDILKWKNNGDLTVDNGGYYTITTRDRINTFLSNGWRIHTYQGTWYWYSHNWPENIRDRLSSDQGARRKPEFPWWIPFSRFDTIKADGTLIFGDSYNVPLKKGICTKDGHLKLEDDPGLRPPPEGNLAPMRKSRRSLAYNNPAQMHLRLEGKYMRKLAHWKRIKAKHDKMREVTKMQNELEKLDKPDKRKKKKDGHQFLR